MIMKFLQLGRKDIWSGGAVFFIGEMKYFYVLGVILIFKFKIKDLLETWSVG